MKLTPILALAFVTTAGSFALARPGHAAWTPASTHVVKSASIAETAGWRHHARPKKPERKCYAWPGGCTGL
jgi:hypothetical protein